MLLEKIRATLVQNAPAFFKIPCAFMPPAIQQNMMLELLKRIFSEALEDGDFAFLEDRWLEVNVRDIGFQSYISFANEKLVVRTDTITPDVSFSGNLNDLILIAARKEDPDTLFFQRRLLIEGDTELGLEVKNLMDSVDFESLPTVLRHGLMTVADFVQKGLQPPEIQQSEVQQIEQRGIYAHKS